ncbi:MAG: [protein-PII] uridylyltransferase [Rudaea sp.]|nr:[protein-PII] uridylyltransferase [Rudaea sp.]
MSLSAANLPTLPRLPSTVPRSGVSDVARLALRQLLGDIARQLADAFRAGAKVESLLAARSDAVTRIVAHVWNACVGDPPDLALYAVGGYGRAELFPFSDVDLLALCEMSPQASTLRALESFFTCLWDVGLRPGHALRTLDECRKLAAQDATIYTSLLDARRIAGAATLDAGLASLLDDEKIWPRPAYLAARRADREHRHVRFDDTAYNLEPNIKEGPGGLRALHLIHWLGKRLFGATGFSTLAQRGMLSVAEAATAEHAQKLLQRIRFALHLAAGRAEERLLFDYQRTLALQFGFIDEHRQNLAVEQFMQGYYRAAIALERLSAQFLRRCEEALDPEAQLRTRRLSLDFISVGDRLDCDPPDLFLQRPAALIDLFRVWGENPEIKSLRADLVRRIDDALAHWGDALMADDDVNLAFARLLRRGAVAVEALARMNHYGVLARYLPAFGRVVGRMQYDLFHVYTVDEHTIRVLRNVARFADASASAEFTGAHELWARLSKPELLLLAALFHDIAKGRGGDHSELGETEAREFCTRLRLPSADVDLVAWLVRRHLLMSVTAQRQDITDPEVVHRFAAEVADWERLDYLYLLTVADISGTSAKLWNSWKDKLLADLYINARFALRSGLERVPHADERVRECQQLARALLQAQGIDDATVAPLWADFPEESFLRFSAEQIAWQTAGIARAGSAEPLVLIQAQGSRGGTEVFVHAADRDGLFAAITAVLDRMRLSVLDARVVTSRSGMSLDSFLVLDSEGHALTDPARIARLQRALTQALGQTPYHVDLVARASSRSLRHFPIATRIEFSPQPVRGRTQVAIVCADRPGLLAAVAQLFRERRIRVHDARIATFGERVEDFFLISDEHDMQLDATACEALRSALIHLLDAPREQHGAA